MPFGSVMGALAIGSDLRVVSKFSEMSRSFTSALASESASGRSRTIDTSISPPSFLMSSCRPFWAWCRRESLILANTSFPLFQQTCFIMAPKTGSKKLVEPWRPERDLHCSSAVTLSILHEDELQKLN